MRRAARPVRDWALARRALLQGLGLGAACLPLLRATRSYAATPSFPRRFLCALQTEGYQVGYVAPPTDGPIGGRVLPLVTSPLEAYKNDIIILTNLGNPAYAGTEGWGHGTYGTVFTAGPVDAMTGDGKQYWEPTIPSVDQVVAEALSRDARNLTRKSLATGVRVSTAEKYPGAYRCFWAGAKQPITPEEDPNKIYTEIFAGKTVAPDAAVARMLSQRKSLLDFVGGDLKRFGQQLGTEDRPVVEAHLQSIRSIEQSLATPPAPGLCLPTPPGDPSKPYDILSNLNIPLIMDAHFQLMVAALKCDVTRVATLQFGDASGGSITFPFIGVNRNWHSLGHDPGVEKLSVDQWCMKQFASLIARFKAVEEGPGESMLDHSVILWANHMESSTQHSPFRLPWILAGKAGGFFKTGTSFSNSGKPINAVLTSICNAMGITTPWFGDPKYGGPMTEIHA